MKQQRVVILLLLLLVGVTACSPGHLGSNVVAFIHDGQLWTMDPDGANAFAVVKQNTPVIGYAWSPSHQIFAFRTVDATFARQPANKTLLSNPASILYADMPSTLNTVGVDGGTPIELAISNPITRYSNMMWNSNSTRLLYAESNITSTAKNWYVSQNDQPVGIALKSLPGSYSIPSFSYDAQHYLAIGNSLNGVFTTTIAGTQFHALSNSSLPGHPLSDGLERLLWRPRHGNSQFLYALPSSDDTSTSTVRLVLGTLSGGMTTIASCSCTQFAWSPDGNHILTRDTSEPRFHDTLLDLSGHAFSIQVNADTLPYWSSDGRFLLLTSQHEISLVNIATQQQRTLLLSDQPESTATNGLAEPSSGFSRPVPNNLWAPDNLHFLFLARNAFHWQQQATEQRAGLYTVTIHADGIPQGNPHLIDTGNDSQPGWSYQDPNTSFLTL